METKKVLAIILSIILLAAIVFYAFKLSKPEEASYSGISNNAKQNVNVEQISNGQGETKSLVVANDPAFNPRSMSGGGEKPGWLISVTESQPKIFTGKFFYNNGVDTYDVFLQEQDGFFTGEAKDKAGNKTELSVKKEVTECKDSDKNVYEYSLTATFNGDVISGCGGKATSQVK